MRMVNLSTEIYTVYDGTPGMSRKWERRAPSTTTQQDKRALLLIQSWRAEAWKVTGHLVLEPGGASSIAVAEGMRLLLACLDGGFNVTDTA